MARVLVTGGAGFIGSHTVERLVHLGHTVAALDNLESGSWANLSAVEGGCERIEADVRDGAALAAIMARGRYDAVIHLAARASVVASIERPVETHALNVGGTLNVLEAARRAEVRRVVLASSTAVYGRTPPLPTPEEAPPRPASPYAAHKAEAELLCAAYRETFGLEALPLRYFNVYGPRQPADSPYAGVVAGFMRRLASGTPITIDGDGEQTRDFIHVTDVAAVNARAALDADPGGGAINVGSGVETSVLGLLSALQVILRADATIRFGPPRPADVRRSCAAIDALRERLGYSPAIALADGLRDLVTAARLGA